MILETHTGTDIEFVVQHSDLQEITLEISQNEVSGVTTVTVSVIGTGIVFTYEQGTQIEPSTASIFSASLLMIFAVLAAFRNFRLTCLTLFGVMSALFLSPSIAQNTCPISVSIIAIQLTCADPSKSS